MKLTMLTIFVTCTVTAAVTYHVTSYLHECPETDWCQYFDGADYDRCRDDDDPEGAAALIIESYSKPYPDDHYER